MARTLAQIQKQIDDLNQIADKLKAREVADVVQRIRGAIDHYGLTVEDLFGTKSRPAAASASKPFPNKKPSAKKSPSPVRYRDHLGNAWTGNGQRPRWFKEALASGKTREDLQVNA